MPDRKKVEDQTETPDEYDAFEELARKLVRVPKPEIEKALAAHKNGDDR